MPIYCSKCNKQVDPLIDSGTGRFVCSKCGKNLYSVAQLDPGMLINGFLIEGKIGQGGMGIVYKSKQLNLDRYVALKVLSDELSQDTEFVERFFREARAAASLSHPNIVQVYDAGTTTDGIYYFAMELIEGETLENRILRDGCLPPKDALSISLKLAQALEYAWEKQRLCHGDIKPDNVILNSSGGVKLADLGLAKTLHEDRTKRDGIMATPLYAPPEIIAGDLHRIDCRSDMYSFGATFYHMLAGVPPFLDNDIDTLLKKHMNEKPAPLSGVIKELNPSVSLLVEKLLMKNPEDRPDSWGDIVKSIEKIHDVERKIFHRFATPKTAQPKSEETHALIPGHLFLSGLIKNAIKLLVVLSCILVVFFLVKKPAVPEPKLIKDSVARRIAAEWKKIKDEAPLISREKSVENIQNFINKYKENLPDEASAFLESHKKLLAKEKKMDNAKQDFEKELFLLKAMTSEDLTKFPIEKVHSIHERIQNLLDSAAKAVLQIPEDDRALLNALYLRSHEIITAYEKEEEKKKQEEEARKEEEKREQEKKKREEQEQSRQAKLAQNALIDGYYLAISAYTSQPVGKRDMTVLKNAFEKWRLENKNIPQNIQAKADILKKYFIETEPTIIPILVKYKNLFVGKQLSIEEYAGFTVDELNEKSIKISKSVSVDESGKMKTMKSVPWKQISPENLYSMLKQKIINGELKLEAVEQAMISSFLFSNGLTGELNQFIEMLQGVSNEEKNNWKSLLHDFEISLSEKEYIGVWDAFRKTLKDKPSYEASKILLQLMLESESSEFSNRYADEINLQSGIFRPFNPQLDAFFIMESCKTLIKDKKYRPALSCIMTAKSRCGGAGDLNQELKNKLSFYQAQIISRISTDDKFKKSSDEMFQFIPFYRWEYEVPGEAVVYSQLLRNVNPEGNEDILSTLSFAANLSSGNWGTAYKISLIDNVLKPAHITKLKDKIQIMAPSFMFSYALINSRYGTLDSQKNILNLLYGLSDLFQETPQLYSINLHLSFEYALLLNNPVFVIKNIGKYDFSPKNQNRDMSMRVAILHLIAMVEKDDVPAEEIEVQFKKYSDIFSKDKHFEGDLFWCEMAVSILKNSSISDDQLKILLEKPCLAQDACGRLMCDTITRNFLNGKRLENEKGIRQLIKSKVTGNLESSGLWRKIGVFNIARIYNAGGILAEIKNMMQDSSLSSIDFYPRLCMLKTGFEIMTGATQKEAAEDSLKIFLESSEVSSESERQASSILKASKPEEIVSQMNLKGESETAFWTGILGMAANYKDKEKAKTIDDVLKENIGFYGSEQRVFLRNMERLILGTE